MSLSYDLIVLIFGDHLTMGLVLIKRMKDGLDAIKWEFGIAMKMGAYQILW
jgi:hypothetical protein